MKSENYADIIREMISAREAEDRLRSAEAEAEWAAKQEFLMPIISVVEAIRADSKLKSGVHIRQETMTSVAGPVPRIIIQTAPHVVRQTNVHDIKIDILLSHGAKRGYIVNMSISDRTGSADIQTVRTKEPVLLIPRLLDAITDMIRVRL